ncbi:uncharacterized protein [Onthophagus taurus]|uniref:uncharacterized protein n=1 Tax=Onthophagus taurus TaxID=166361 RepID=UPI0039BE6E87
MIDVNDKVRFLTENILTLFDAHAPVRTFKERAAPTPWITDTIRRMQKLRDKAYKKYRSLKTNEFWQYYKDMRNYVKGDINRERKAYVSHCMGLETNPWIALRKCRILTRTTDSISEQLADSDQINNYFTNIAPLNGDIDRDLYQSYMNNVVTKHIFNFECVSDAKIEEVINCIRSNATGLDGLNIKMIHYCCPHIIPQIKDKVNCCLSDGRFPDVWKKAKIVPLPKKKKPDSFADLRPISILPVLSKVLEKIMCEQLQAFVYKHKLLSET